MTAHATKPTTRLNAANLSEASEDKQIHFIKRQMDYATEHHWYGYSAVEGFEKLIPHIGKYAVKAQKLIVGELVSDSFYTHSEIYGKPTIVRGCADIIPKMHPDAQKILIGGLLSKLEDSLTNDESIKAGKPTTRSSQVIEDWRQITWCGEHRKDFHAATRTLFCEKADSFETIFDIACDLEWGISTLAFISRNGETRLLFSVSQTDHDLIVDPARHLVQVFEGDFVRKAGKKPVGFEVASEQSVPHLVNHMTNFIKDETLPMVFREKMKAELIKVLETVDNFEASGNKKAKMAKANNREYWLHAKLAIM